MVSSNLFIFFLLAMPSVSIPSPSYLPHKTTKLQKVTQGGDWGAWITRTLGLLHPTSCLASHINMIGSRESPQPRTLSEDSSLTPSERAGLDRSAWFQSQGSGYSAIQSTKPQTLGYLLSDSPIGLLAWIYEKLHDWTDAYPWTDDEILTWTCIYAFSTAGPAASIRVYKETRSVDEGVWLKEKTRGYVPHVKLGLAYYPRDIYVHPVAWARGMGEIVFEKMHERGGHFAAWEWPESVAGDLKEMFGRGGGAEGVVRWRDGTDLGGNGTNRIDAGWGRRDGMDREGDARDWMDGEGDH